MPRNKIVVAILSSSIFYILDISMMNLVYPLIAFACLASGSTANPFYTNSSATTHIATSTSSSANKAQTDTNSTVPNSPIGLTSWSGLGCKHDQSNAQIHS